MPPFSQPVHDVVDASGTASAVDSLARAPMLAVDLEADSMHAFRARLCFLQAGTDEDIYLLDTLSPGVAASALGALFADPARTKVFHAAQGDLQFLAEAGVRVRGLFDTHRAATLLGWPKVGLGDLVSEKLGVTLAKEHQQADFSVRPLPPALRTYIADDVRYLTELGRVVRAAVDAADIAEEVALDCERLTDEAADVPMGRMLSNAAIQELVSRPVRDKKALARTQGVRGQVVREHGDEVLELLASLRAAADRGELPPPEAPARDSGRRRREDALKAFRSEKAAERKVTPSVVLPNPLVDELAATPPADVEALARVPYFGEKRVGLYGADLVALLRSRD